MNHNLRLRIMTAIVLGSLVLSLLYFGSDLMIQVFIGVVILLAANEWLKFAKVNKSKPARPISLIILGLILLANSYAPNDYWQYLAVGWWLIAVLALPFFPQKTIHLFKQPLIMLSGLIVLVGAFQALLWLIAQKDWLWLLLILVWAADIGAYFVGKRFGKTKLAVNISPGKTIEGLIGGILVATLLGSLCLYFNQTWQYQFLILMPIVVFFSVVGDLVISCYKRQANLKDSGSLLPGHGGVLDRIDGLLAAAPIFTLLIKAIF